MGHFEGMIEVMEKLTKLSPQTHSSKGSTLCSSQRLGACRPRATQFLKLSGLALATGFENTEC